VDATAVILALLTVLLIPWMGWTSRQLLLIQIKLARGEENFERLQDAVDDHEQRIRTLESFHYQRKDA